MRQRCPLADIPSLMESLFADFDARAVAHGQAAFNQWIVTLLSAVDPDLVHRLERAAVSPVTEPLFFAYFASPQPSVTLEQLAYGYLPPELRRDPTVVRTDAEGVVYLPRIGYLHTPTKDCSLRLSSGGEGNVLQLETDDGLWVPFRLVRPLTVTESPLEISRRNHPLLAALYRDESGEPHDVEVKGCVTKQRVWQLTTALEIVRAGCPWFHELMSLVMRRVVLFACPRLNSFAALAAHGMAFFNIGDDDDELFFVEDVAHQCGHVLFLSLTFERERWLQVDPDIPMSRINAGADHQRTAYVILHGVFTEAVMALCLDRCYERQLLPVAKEHELLGRLAYILVRFQRDLAELGRAPVLTPEGVSLAQQFARVLESVGRARHDRLLECDVSNQPYTFSYRLFAERNPLPLQPRPRRRRTPAWSS